MSREEMLNRLSAAETELRAIAHSHGTSIDVAERVHLAIAVVRDAWVLVNEGLAQVPTMDAQVRVVRALIRKEAA